MLHPHAVAAVLVPKLRKMPAARTHAPLISGVVWIATGLQCLLIMWVATDNYGWARLGQVLVAFLVEPMALGAAFLGAKSAGLPRSVLVVVVLAGVTVALLELLPWGAARIRSPASG